ncbi:MAG: TetR/AcrR family transcriptional regulator [Bacillota bacterium]|nr:TetR/AcrR family transcriptional regulator [Bacillota bacterium]
MEDLRIQKTRKALKQALVRLLSEKSFEKISVTDICKESGISRITFYTHYDHKFDLAQEIFSDYIQSGRTMFQLKKNNQKLYPNTSEDIQNCLIYLDCFVELIIANPQFFSPIFTEDNPYLLSMMTSLLLDSVERFSKKQELSFKLKFSPRQIAGFIIYGVAGFAKESSSAGKDIKTIESDVKRLLVDMLDKSIFYEK